MKKENIKLHELNNFLFSSECSKIIEIATKESKYLKPNDEAVDFHIPIIAKFWRNIS